jgi:hypothetical protein
MCCREGAAGGACVEVLVCTLKSLVKVLYYQLFALVYGLVGGCAGECLASLVGECAAPLWLDSAHAVCSMQQQKQQCIQLL